MKLIRKIKNFIERKIEIAVKCELTKIFFQSGSVAVDHHVYQESWAVIKVDSGDGTCYLRFLNLGKQDLLDLQRFLRRFEKGASVDAVPGIFSRYNKTTLFN